MLGTYMVVVVVVVVVVMICSDGRRFERMAAWWSQTDRWEWIHVGRYLGRFEVYPDESGPGAEYPTGHLEPRPGVATEIEHGRSLQNAGPPVDLLELEGRPRDETFALGADEIGVVEDAARGQEACSCGRGDEAVHEDVGGGREGREETGRWTCFWAGMRFSMMAILEATYVD